MRKLAFEAHSWKSWSLGLALLLGVFSEASRAQTPKGTPDPDLPPPPLTYRGLIPGVSTIEEAREKLGAPVHEARWYAYKLLYPASRGEGLLDSLHFRSRDGKTGVLGDVEAASVPGGWETWKAVHGRLGEPEFFLELHRSSMADYSEKGLRFTFDRQGNTIGIVYVPRGRVRVHSGQRHFLGLRHLRQGPQEAPEKPADMRGLRVGVAEVDITPQKPEWLGPTVTAENFSVHDRLRARIAVLERGDLRLAIVGADLFGFALSETRPIEEALAREGISHLILASSHNHAAADTIGVYGFFPKDYVTYIQDQLRRGVLEARGKLQPVARWLAASDELPMDGARVQGLIRNARNPGVLDPQLAVLQAVGADGRPIVTFVHFACHVEGLEKGFFDTSADFPGYLCAALEKKLGGAAIFLNGALGGMVSGDTRARTHEEARRAGERFAREAERILGFATPPASDVFSIERRRLEVPLTNLKFQLLIKTTGRRPLVHGRIVSEMNLIRIGDAEILTIPGELLPELGFEIVEKMRGYPRLIVGLANDQLGYMIPGQDFNDDQYEEGMSVGPAIGPMVREQAIRMLEATYEPGRFRRPPP